MGLKIVCLFKKHGTTLAAHLAVDQVSEAELPERLLEEFSKLSEGLLSNVALGTIARIRDVTHQIVGSFNGDMDGPYFHHRATIFDPSKAEEYAVNIVLSGLSSAIKRQNIGRDLAGRVAIEHRVKSIAGGRESLKHQYKKNNGEPRSTDINVHDVIKLITQGCTKKNHGLIRYETPNFTNFKSNFTSLFSSDIQKTVKLMSEFAVLTSIRSHPGNFVDIKNESRPELGLGAIVQDTTKKYWLCLQASCDSVRLRGAQDFLFVQLEKSENQPQYIVPYRTDANRKKFICLDVPNKGYTQVTTFRFRSSPTTKTVLAKESIGNKNLHFKSVDGQEFTWIAQLKQRRALRAVSDIGRQMARPGFDEFEPFRKKVKI